AQCNAGVDVAVICSPVPRARDAAAEYVIFDVGLVTQLSPNVVVESRSVRRTNCGLTGVEVGTRSYVTRIIAFETCIETPNRSLLVTQQFFAEKVERHAQVGIIDELRIETGKMRELRDRFLSLLWRKPIAFLQGQRVVVRGPLFGLRHDSLH